MERNSFYGCKKVFRFSAGHVICEKLTHSAVLTTFSQKSYLSWKTIIRKCWRNFSFSVSITSFLKKIWPLMMTAALNFRKSNQIYISYEINGPTWFASSESFCSHFFLKKLENESENKLVLPKSWLFSLQFKPEYV